jgi:hypothetical protein
MSKLIACPNCSGFVPSTALACPNCAGLDHGPAGARPRARQGSLARVGRRIVQVTAGGAMAVTLMACYGAPARYQAAPPAPPQPQPQQKAGGEAAPLQTPAHCNDVAATDHSRHSDTAGDNIDQNCDGVDGVKATAEPADTPAPSQPLAPVPQDK